jgi:CPA2 family monovalent cation:H+ antiporter-2
MALGASLGLLDADTHALVVGAALLSITVNQPLQGWLQRMLARYAPGIPDSLTEGDAFDFGAISDHVILVGYGRVGTTITEALDRAGVLHIVVEEQPRVVAGLRLRGRARDRGRRDARRRTPARGGRGRTTHRGDGARTDPGEAHRRGGAAAEPAHRRGGAHAQRDRAGVLRAGAARTGGARARGLRGARGGAEPARTSRWSRSAGATTRRTR